MTRYRLDLSAEQAHTVSCALDLYVRIVGLGQLEEVLGVWCEQADRSDRFETDRDALQHVIAAAKRIGWGFAANQSRGIHSDAVPEDARRAYDVRQVLRHAIASERVREARAEGDDEAARWVEMSVDMRSYSPVSSHPAAKVETVREGKESLRGWRDGEPADPGLYLVAGRSSLSVRVAEMMEQQPEPRRLLGLLRVIRGPRDGYRRPRWVGPRGGVTSWDDEWRWLRLPVEPLDAEALR